MTYQESEREFERIREAAREVLAEFDGLSAPAFWMEVQSRLWPRPGEFDIKAAMLRVSVHEGWLKYDEKMKVRRVE